MLYTPGYTDYLLKQGRESCGRSIEDVCAETGINAEKYKELEAGVNTINITDAKLLSALFKINPEYLDRNNMQLILLYLANEIMQLKDKKITTLVNALKKKMHTKKH